MPFDHDHELDIDRIGLAAAVRIARERGFAERSRILSDLVRRAAASVRGLFSAPRGAGAEPCRSC